MSRILVVDDDPNVVEALMETLEAESSPASAPTTRRPRRV